MTNQKLNKNPADFKLIESNEFKIGGNLAYRTVSTTAISQLKLQQ